MGYIEISLTMSIMMTLILVYTLLKSLKNLDLVTDRYVSIIDMLVGVLLGLGVSYFMKDANQVKNAILGIFVGRDINRLDALIQKMLGNIKR